jgi:hypothetical protein
MTSPEPASSPLAVTMLSLAVDQVAGQVVDAFRRRGIRSVLLKGASFARWLYDDGQARYYADVDLLVAPDHVDAAGTVLTELGYARRYTGGAVGEQADHADNWDRPGSPSVDLHKIVSARIGVTPERCWEVIADHTRAATVGGVAAEVLSPAAMALHVALHAESGRHKTIDDLRRALARLDQAEWRAALELAETLEAVPGFGVGLRLLSEGEELAQRLGVPETTSVELFLQASSTAVLARPFEALAAAPGLRAKAAVVGRELVPTPSFIRLWFAPARRSPWGLAAGYLYRLVWVPWHAPRGLRSWWRARRAVAGERKGAGP